MICTPNRNEVQYSAVWKHIETVPLRILESETISQGPMSCGSQIPDGRDKNLNFCQEHASRSLRATSAQIGSLLWAVQKVLQKLKRFLYMFRFFQNFLLRDWKTQLHYPA